MHLILNYQHSAVDKVDFEIKINDNLQNIAKKHNTSFSKVAVAVSGGCDSLSLIVAVYKLGYDVLAILVNHNLRKESTQEIDITTKTLKKIGIKYVITEWDGNVVKNLEAEARKARYQILFDICKKNNINTLLIGHHLNDQVETFLLNLSRGSGIDGLSSIPEFNIINDIHIIRPMLNLYKQDCKNYLIEQNISWCEDSSNSDTTYKRNRIRNILSHLEDENVIEKRIANAVILIQEVREVIDEVIDKIMLSNCNFDEDKYLYTFDREFFLRQKSYIQKSLLSRCITKISNREYKLRLYQINNIIDNICKKESSKLTIAKCLISWNKNKISIFRNDNNK